MSRTRALAPARFAAVALTALLSTAVPARAEDVPPAPGAPLPPNVVLFVADDLGWGETGMQGATDVPTPAIDRIAREGVRFTQGYVTCPVCAPTRAGLLTGRYGERFGFEHNPGPEARAPDTFGLPREEATLAERLKARGYATGMFGKWHLGYAAGKTPPDRGFDEFFGFLGGAHPYLPGGRDRAPILRGATPVEAPPYLTDALGAEAAGFVERHKDRPFFLYVPFNAVHAPLQATEPHLAPFASVADEKRRTWSAMLAAMDQAIGQVLAALDRAGLAERTLVVFLSDNGGPTRSTTSRNGPLRGFKGDVYEGGVRVPFALRWPGGGLRAGTTYDAPVVSLDVVPTALAAAGAPAAPDARLDGVNLLPHLRGEAPGRPHAALYWRFGAQRAVRVGDWKLVEREGEPPELYRLSDDLAEATNLADRHPGRVLDLQTVWAAWNLENRPAAWGGGGRARIRLK